MPVRGEPQYCNPLVIFVIDVSWHNLLSVMHEAPQICTSRVEHLPY